MDEENNQQIENSQSKNMNPMIIGVVIAVLVIGVGIWFLTRNGSDSNVADQLDESQMEEVIPLESSPGSQTSGDEVTSQEASSKITVEGGAFYFKPSELKVKLGQKVILEFKNAGGMHDFVIDELNVKTKVINSGETATVEFTPTKAGEFEFYCSVSDHRQKGMKGVIVVE